jgi:hypothetical protein
MITGRPLTHALAAASLRQPSRIRFRSMSSTGVIIPFDPTNSQKASAVQQHWAKAGLESAKTNATRLIFEDNGVTGLVSLGKEFASKTANEKNESYKQAVASGVNRLVEADIKEVAVDVGAHPHAAGELIISTSSETILTCPLICSCR